MCYVWYIQFFFEKYCRRAVLLLLLVHICVCVIYTFIFNIYMCKNFLIFRNNNNKTLHTNEMWMCVSVKHDGEKERMRTNILTGTSCVYPSILFFFFVCVMYCTPFIMYKTKKYIFSFRTYLYMCVGIQEERRYIFLPLYSPYARTMCTNKKLFECTDIC